jgi:opacity protein-like surface antigen
MKAFLISICLLFSLNVFSQYPEKENKNVDSSSGGAILFDDNKSIGQQAHEKNLRTSNERVEAIRQVMIGFGPAYFSQMNASHVGLGFQAGYIWNIDDHFDLGLQSDFAISTDHTDAYMFNGKIITNYHFLTQNISPYVGAGFGYGWASIHKGPSILDDKASGFALSLQAGVKFFRTSTVNFSLSGEFTTLFDSSTLGQPGVFMLKAAIYY